MHHEMLTQRALFCHRANTKRGTLSQTHVVVQQCLLRSKVSDVNRKCGHQKVADAIAIKGFPMDVCC